MWFNLQYPSEHSEINDFLSAIYERSEDLVWPIGQFGIELVVWNAIMQLREEGLLIDELAEIKDYYLDRNGVIVIEQEATKQFYYSDTEENELAYDRMRESLRKLDTILEERFGIELRDIRQGNCGIVDGKVKLYDFGLSTSTNLDRYGSYSDYRYSGEEEYDSYNSEESY
jgi:hypothetical protein